MPTRRQLANAIRALSMDAVQKANSGHPGMPMGMADIAQVLWADYLRHNPGNPLWPDRDRFVISNGHGSMLLYSLLYLTGYPMPLEALKNFRQLGYPTPGHPEVEHHLGIETTTGPLGQGLANAVGMALAERNLAATFNRPGIRDRRSSHLGVRGRRLPDGRNLPRGLLAGGHAGPRPADRLLRRQRHLDRRRGARLVHRRHAEAIRSLRLARDPRSRWPRRGGGAPRDRRRARRDGAPVADLLQDHHRLGCAQQAGHRGDAWRRARRSGSRGGTHRARLAVSAFRGARGHPQGLGCTRIRPQGRGRLDCAARGVRRGTPRPRRGAPAAAARRASARLARGAGRVRRGRRRKAGRRRDTQLLAAGAQCARAGDPGAFRRFRGPHRVEQHQPQEIDGRLPRQPRRQLSALRRARVRHDGDHERDRAARRRDSLRRHLPGVLGLRTQRRAHGRADETGSDPGLHARFDRARRGRSDAPADRAPVESADHSQHAPLASLRHRRDRCCMGRRGRAARRSDEPGPHAAGAAGGEAGCRSARGDFARRVRALRAGRRSRVCADRDGLGSRSRARRGARAGNARPPGARRVDALHQPVRRRTAVLSRLGAAARACRASRSKRARARDGGVTSAATAR